MSLRDLFAAAPARSGGNVCKTCVIVDSLDGDDSLVLAEAFANPDISSQMIVNVLKQAGFSVSRSALSRHRRDCR